MDVKLKEMEHILNKNIQELISEKENLKSEPLNARKSCLSLNVCEIDLRKEKGKENS